MLISGIQPFTLLDYPGKTSCIVFTPGCNFRCGYCHNPEFVLPEEIIKLKDSFIPEASFFSFLAKRAGLLAGVVISGGEPTNASDLLGFMGKIKALGFLVKLDTNGSRPDVVAEAIARGLVDYIAMDVKTSLTEYRALVGPFVSPDNIKKSIACIANSGIEYEFRTTLIKEMHSETVLANMAVLLSGTARWYLQPFRPGHTLDSKFQELHPFSSIEMNTIADKLRGVVDYIGVR